jgi:hypothetical protein
MEPKEKGLDRIEDSDEPLENQPPEWAEEDIQIEGRKPDLGETEEDESEL